MSDPTALPHTWEGIPPADQRPASWIGRLLATIGGMRPELIDEFPGERRDFIQMALILFVTATVATLAGAFAIHMAFTQPDGTGPEPWVILVSGLVWGFIIFNIDRYMVLGMEGMHGVRALVPGLIRLLLAVLIGFVMATPLVLQIFNSEIQVAMTPVNFEKAKVAQAKLDEVRLARDKIANDLTQAQLDLEEAKAGSNLEKNQAYKDAQLAYEDALDACNVAQNKATLEMRGQLPLEQGGSGRPGDSDVYRQFQRTASDLCSIASSKKEAMDRVGTMGTLSPEQVAQNVELAQDVVEARARDLESANEELRKLIEESDRAAKWSSGLLTRLQALEEVRKSSPLGEWAHWAIIGLLASIEVLPVLFKLFKQFSRTPTAYECRWRDLDNAALERARAVQRHALSSIELAAYAPVAAARAQQDVQDQVNAYMAHEVSLVQLEVMRYELARWAAEHGVNYTPSAFQPSDPPPAGTPPSPPADERFGGLGGGPSPFDAPAVTEFTWTPPAAPPAFDDFVPPTDAWSPPAAAPEPPASATWLGPVPDAEPPTPEPTAEATPAPESPAPQQGAEERPAEEPPEAGPPADGAAQFPFFRRDHSTPAPAQHSPMEAPTSDESEVPAVDGPQEPPSNGVRTLTFLPPDNAPGQGGARQ